MQYEARSAPRRTARSRRHSLRGRVATGLLAGALVAGTASITPFVAGAAGASTTARAAAGYSGKITYWFWGESDIPGITKWMQQRIAIYEKLHPKVSVDLVPQSNTTIISSFKLAAQSKTGPTIDTQWATLDTLVPAFSGDVAPLNGLVPKSEMSHWINTNENTYKGQVMAMPLYLIGVPLVWNKALFKKAGLNPNKGPATWSQFLSDAKALKAHGITPLGMGNQDGYFGAWMFAIYMKQELNSLSQVTKGIANQGNAQSIFESKLKSLYTMMQALVKDGYVNSNVSSLSLNQGWQLFPEKKAAMSFTTDGNVLSWAKAVGEANIGVGRPPIWGTGSLASTYDVTQSSDEFITSWAPNKQLDANFLAWLHTPSNMAALNKETDAFPADNRFPVSSITDPLARQLYKLDTTGKSIWLENYLPPQVDSDADIPAGQMILSNSGSPAKAVALWTTQLNLWRTEQPTQFQQFKTWAASS
ncbi:MAG: extracellular solute-binding protein [Actinomycetota bacterium]|nr:extracellular solute-binding protein [Actinomycetota bacterium]